VEFKFLKTSAILKSTTYREVEAVLKTALILPILVLRVIIAELGLGKELEFL